MKYLLIIIVVTSNIFGMKGDDKKYHHKRYYYAQTGKPSLVQGAYIKQIMYPISVHQDTDDKIHSSFNFHTPIETIAWHKKGKYTLYVTEANGTKHTLILKELQSHQSQNQQQDY